MNGKWVNPLVVQISKWRKGREMFQMLEQVNFFLGIAIISQITNLVLK
jgi:hypothetical protein